MRRPLLLALAGLAALAAAIALAVVASAALDRPVRAASSGVTVEATKGEVWRVLTDFAAYDSWNPIFRSARGRAEEGRTIPLELALPGREPEHLDASVLVARPERKLWWQARMLAPGVRDWEYEVILQPLEGGRVLVVQELRVEGLLAPLEDAGDASRALELLGDALRERLAEVRAPA